VIDEDRQEDEARQEEAGDAGAGQPSEEELRAQLEEEIRRVRVQDVVLQSLVSILNLTARRIAKDDERDLEQAKVGIDAARALTDLVPSDAQAQIRQAISELQLLYAQHAGGEEPEGPSGEGGPGLGGGAPEGPQPSSGGPGGATGGGGRKSGLWTPHERD